MKISLVQCPVYGVDSPPLGLAYLAEYLNKKHDVKIFDINIDLFNKVNKKKYWSHNKSFEWKNPEVVTKFGIKPRPILSEIVEGNKFNAEENELADALVQDIENQIIEDLNNK